jgi:predicted transcriptional regulator
MKKQSEFKWSDIENLANHLGVTPQAVHQYLSEKKNLMILGLRLHKKGHTARNQKMEDEG